MSGANADCHVSTKWEDTGGKDDPECDSNVLLDSSNTNGDSLQELIEKELALRSSVVTNGVDRPNSLPIRDSDDENNEETSSPVTKKDAFDIFDSVSPVNGCKRSGSFKLTRGVAVTEVDDFDVLYNEVSSDEQVSNGHVTLTGLLSPETEHSIASSLSDDRNEKSDVGDANESRTSILVEADSIGGQSTSFSDETESSSDSVRMVCRANTISDFVRKPFDNLVADDTSNDFVPISEVDIIEGDTVSSVDNIADDHSTVSITSMIDVQKVVEDMEDSRPIIIDDNDLITDTQECGNQRQNHDSDTVVVGTAAEDVSNISQQCHKKNNIPNGFSTEKNEDDAAFLPERNNANDADHHTVQYNGDVTDDARDVLVLDRDSCDDEFLNLSERKSDQTASAVFENGFEKWTTETTNVAVIAATCEKIINSKNRCQLIEECSYDLTKSGDVVSESNLEEKKTVKKKKSTSEESVTTTKTKKTKKTKKCEEKENISVNNNELKQNGLDDPNFHQIVDDGDELSNVCVRDLRSGFGKFDQLTKKTVMHVRSSDAAKAPQQFSQNDASQDSGNRCKACNKNVFAMEQIKAERHVWHKNCFRCKTCNKQLTVDVYSSHEGELFCKPHFRDLFKPKTVIEEEQTHSITRSTVVREKPIAFNNMNDVKKNWENGQATRKEERLEQRREELQNIRSRIFQGKQNKMKEAYENAVAESERSNVKKDVEIRSEKARSIKEKFEKGEVLPSDESDSEPERKTSSPKDDMDVFEAGISKQSRSIFQQMDAAIKTQSSNSVVGSPTPTMQNGHRSYRESASPEPDVPKNPDVIRCDEQIEDEDEVLKKSNTTSKMLSIFRQMEVAQENVSDGPRPMKKFTPPPQSYNNSESESDEESERSEVSNPNDDIVRASDKTEDEYLIMAQKAAKAKALKEKFEKWEPERQLSSNSINLQESEQANIDTTKSIRARFESMRAEQPADKPRPKINRFVEKSLPGFCDRCFKTVYPLEKVEAGDKIFHRNCFKCSRCLGILRMETFTMNNGHLYCVAHFKQLFITKGNYDEGFGNHQHKAKWPVHTTLPVANGIH